jgi:hypothetical protein
MRKFLFSTAAALAFATALPMAAQATPALQFGLSTGAATGGVQFWESPIAIGAVQPYSGSFGTASGSVVISSKANPSNPQFDMNITDLSMQSGQITLYLTETGLTNFGGAELGSTLTDNPILTPQASNLMYSLYADASDGAFGLGTLIGSTSLAGSATSATLNGTFDATSPFSVTEVLTIDSGASGIYASLDGGTSVPEPGSLALLGTGMLMLGWLVRKRHRNASI